jgi:hypothetical protein
VCRLHKIRNHLSFKFLQDKWLWNIYCNRAVENRPQVCVITISVLNQNILKSIKIAFLKNTVYNENKTRNVYTAFSRMSLSGGSACLSSTLKIRAIYIWLYCCPGASPHTASHNGHILWDEFSIPCWYKSVSCVIDHSVATLSTSPSSLYLWLTRFYFSAGNSW